MTDNPNYCQHPECHNSRVAYYLREWWPSRTIWLSFFPMDGADRWCKSHALINEGVSFG